MPEDTAACEESMTMSPDAGRNASFPGRGGHGQRGGEGGLQGSDHNGERVKFLHFGPFS
jgi:hypothetical protein